MKKGQVFVRAKSPSGKWGSHDVLDLDQPSFNAFVIGMMHRFEMVVGFKDEAVNASSIELKSTVELKD